MPKAFAFLFAFFSLSLFLFNVFPSNLKGSDCANSESCIKDLSGIYDSESNIAEYQGNKIRVPAKKTDSETPENVLSVVTSEAKRIEVDLTNQMLYAYENNNEIMKFPVSTGKWGRTPTGTFKIWVKLRYTRMSGGVPGTGTYYNLPNVPYTMYFFNDEIPKIRGYGLHGAYWHNNFGHPMSHGCVNISPENAGRLYNWAEPVAETSLTYASEENPGTTIIIYGTAPRE